MSYIDEWRIQDLNLKSLLWYYVNGSFGFTISKITILKCAIWKKKKKKKDFIKKTISLFEKITVWPLKSQVNF
jgi:hypothetical protein